MCACEEPHAAGGVLGDVGTSAVKGEHFLFAEIPTGRIGLKMMIFCSIPGTEEYSQGYFNCSKQHFNSFRLLKAVCSG